MRRNVSSVSRLFAASALAALTAAVSPSALAHDAPAPKDSSTFGTRTELPDGSTVVTVGRSLPTEWDTRLGFDANLAPMKPSVLPAFQDKRDSTGAVWGSMTGPSVAPLIYDKTEIGARLDQNDDNGRIAATLSRTVPLGDGVSVTLRDQYAVTQSLNAAHSSNPNAGTAAAWSIDRSVRLSLGATGTTLSAGTATTSEDGEWHNRLSAEQQIVGPLTVSTSVTDPGSGSSIKSITAGFKHTW
jgi:hypothetical protein